MMKDILAQLVAGQTLSEVQAHDAFAAIMDGESSAAQTAGVLALMQTRGPTEDELVGAARVMRERVARVDVPQGMVPIDTCGTGGDHAGTFNISTAAALVAAAAARSVDSPVVVAKHGNRSVTSRSGSSQVLEALGVKLQVTPETLTRCLSEAAICFCFAPAHHPAMKHAAPVRQDLGFRTIFNLLGPLTNPAGANRQVIGVYEPRLTRLLAGVLRRLGSDAAMIVHGQIPDEDGEHIDGLDELSTCGPSRVSRLRDGQIHDAEFDPMSLGLPFSHPSALRVDSPEASADKIREVIQGKPGPSRDITCLNAAAALVVGGVVDDLRSGMDLAGDAIDSHAAKKTLYRLIRLTQGD